MMSKKILSLLSVSVLSLGLSVSAMAMDDTMSSSTTTMHAAMPKDMSNKQMDVNKKKDCEENKAAAHKKVKSHARDHHHHKKNSTHCDKIKSDKEMTSDNMKNMAR